MSRFGKKPIVLPQGVTASLEERTLTVRGPKGVLSRTLADDVAVTLSEREVAFAPACESNHARALSSTYAAHLSNMIAGVTGGFAKRLEIEGVGYRVEARGNDLALSVGFSHPVVMSVPAGLAVAVEKNVIAVSGIDKESVGQFAAAIRRVKPPEPYKGKGIRYEGEYVLRKQGKRATA